jgi:putative membrane protein
MPAVAYILVQIVVNAIALWVAARLVGAQFPGDLWQLFIVTVVYGVLQTIVRPILNILTCPAYVLTLGLFTFIMNVIILWLLERISNWINPGMVGWGGFWNMLVAGIIISIVCFLLNLFLGGDRKDRNR